MARGAKPGERRGGRAKGIQNRKTRALNAIVEHVASEGITPLEVMAEAMRHFHAEARAEQPIDSTKLMLAVSIAEKMAPYVHPKLATVAPNADSGAPVPDLVISVKSPDGTTEQEIRVNGSTHRTTGPRIPVQ